MSDPFIGEIILFAGNFAPRGWAFCQGQILKHRPEHRPVLDPGHHLRRQWADHLRPARPARACAGRHRTRPWPAQRQPGRGGGEPTHTLINTEMPAHNHPAQGQIKAAGGGGNSAAPGGNFPAASTTRDSIYSNAADTTMNANASQVTVGAAGGSQPHNNMQPYLGLNYIIAIEGIYPSRN